MRTLPIKIFLILSAGFLASLLSPPEIVTARTDATHTNNTRWSVPNPPVNQRPSGGKTAPDFTLYDQYGMEVKLHDFKGKYIHLDFSAIWCGPCRRQASYMGRLERKLEPLGFVSISVIISDKPEAVKHWARKYKLETVLIDRNRFAKRSYRASRYPTNYILRPDMSIAGRWLGAHRNPEAFERQLRRMVPEMFHGKKPSDSNNNTP